MLPCDEKSVAGDIDFSVQKLLRLINRLNLDRRFLFTFRKHADTITSDSRCTVASVEHVICLLMNFLQKLIFLPHSASEAILNTAGWRPDVKAFYLFIIFIFSSKIPDIDVLNHPG